MPKKKRSFFERLTGSVSLDDNDSKKELEESSEEEALLGDPSVGELTVDVFQTPSEIIIRSMVAGVKPDDLEIAITRDMVTIGGKREVDKRVEESDYFFQELYWGSFSRTISLPQEVDVDNAEASCKNGLLTLRLPKIDKNKQTKVKVRGGE